MPKPGEFWMGTEGGAKDERRHRRQIDRSFAIASKEVTVDQFHQFRMDHQPDKSCAPTGDCPMNNVSWYDAAAYCNWLSEQEGIPKKQWCYLPNKEGKYAKSMTMAPDYLKLMGYRLPTEAEWEYACRASADTEWSHGESVDLLAKYAWFHANSFGKNHAVGFLRSNDLGLFDMHGNDWEWCQDIYGAYPKVVDNKAIKDYDEQTIIDQEKARVLRGGPFNNQASDARSANRHSSLPTNRTNDYGFRVARTFVP
jgi:formylglycine-generating enzyme required for sulfatase activity